MAAVRNDWTFSMSKKAGPYTTSTVGYLLINNSNLLLELLDTLRLDLVHQTTEHNAVLENFSEISLGQLLIKDSFNPL